MDPSQFDFMQITRFLLVGLFIVSGYFTPTIIAISRNHVNKLGIFLLNLLLGWSIIGWILALVWSVLKRNRFPR